MDLTVAVGSLRLANPVIAASGTFGYGAEFSHLTDLNKLGGIVVKGLSLRADGRRPCAAHGSGGGRNAQRHRPAERRRGQIHRRKAARPARLPHSRHRQRLRAHGRGVSRKSVRHLESAEGLAAYELNISCPNTACGGIQFGSDPRLVSQVVSAARAVARRRPLWVKLSPLVTDIALIARAAAEAGADALTVANTYPAMSIDFRTRRSRLGNPTGGLSGRAIKPITLRLVNEAYRAVRIPIIGLGGISSAEDVLEYMVAGATAVQVGTASFADPQACEQIIGDLRQSVYI